MIGTIVLDVIPEDINQKIENGMPVVEIAQAVHIITAGETLDVLTVHRVHIKNQVNMMFVIIARLGNINHIQQNNRVLNVKQENVQEVGVLATDIQLKRLVIFVLKARHLWPKMKNV